MLDVFEEQVDECGWNGMNKGRVRACKGREEAQGQTEMGLVEHGKNFEFILHN